MTTQNKFLKKIVIIALAAGSLLGTAAWADTITGSMTAAPASVNLNLSAGYAFYGNSFTPATDPSNVGNFSTLVAVGGYTSQGSDATYNLATYNNGTTSALNSPNYSLAQDLTGGSSSATVSITTTLFATNEYVSVYIFGYDTVPDFSATVGSANYAVTNVVLPTTADGNGTGEGHTFGVLKLAVTGIVGETLTITAATDTNGVSGGNGFATVGISSVTAGSTTNAISGSSPVPNPPTISPAGGIVAGTNVTLTEILLPQVSNPPYTYQWRSNSVNIGTSVTSNSSTNVFSINTTGFAVGSYNYQVVVTNSVGGATSAPVVLNIVTLSPLPGTSLIPTVWWEANATNNIINNGAVAQLTDQSGHENNAVQDTQNGTPLPLMVSNVVNGLPALSFGGTNCLISPTGATTGNSSHSIFIVGSYTSIAQFRNGAVFYSDTAGVNQNSCLGVDPNTSHLWVGGYGQDNSPYVGNISLNGAGFNILGKIYTASSANYQGFVAGVQDVNATGATYNLGNTRVGLGKQYNNGSYWAGQIAEVIVFNSALTYSDIQSVQHYLASKYNVPLALPVIPITATPPYVAVGSNVAVTVTVPALTTTTTVTITSDNPSVTGFSSTNLTFTLGATNVQTFNVNILAVGTANLTASSSSYNNGTLAIGGLPPTTLIEDYQASSLTSLNGGAAVNNGGSITAWSGEINPSWSWEMLNGGTDPTFLAQGTPALTPAIDFQGGSLDVAGGSSGLVAGRNNFSVALVFKADAAGVGASGTQWAVKLASLMTRRLVPLPATTLEFPFRAVVKSAPAWAAPARPRFAGQITIWSLRHITWPWLPMTLLMARCV